MTATPDIGQLVHVRGLPWVVTDVHETAEPEDNGCTVVDLLSVAEGGFGRGLRVVWEIEPGRRVLETQTLPDVSAGRFDRPELLAAFLDAIRWSAVTSADTSLLQAPFRSGVAIEDYQLEPVARALRAPRVNLLIADDVGLGKTIEAGLVARELLLRHRARRIMIVSPAGLTVKWHTEMMEKFGLDFKVVDADLLTQLRRTHGLAANPFRVHPLTIVSLPWLRRPRAQRLLDEVLPPDGPSYPRTFDLLILDEAHHVAPAAPKQAYPVDSQQIKVTRRLADHFEHRLFLSATPHNGYTESFTALLEMLDPQRFARGVDPDPAAQDDVVVRRLKDSITDTDGRPKFPGRTTQPIIVDYPDDERQVHQWLVDYARRRRERLRSSKAAQRAADLVTLLLKKRLFSSPRAFAQTISVHLETIQRQSRSATAAIEEVPVWLEDWLDDGTLDDDAVVEAENDALGRSARLQPSPTAEELDLLQRMQRWALTREATADAKTEALLGYLTATCRPDRHWTSERVVVFTEYRDTQSWLAALLEQAGLGGDRLELLHGGMPVDERERLRVAFQAAPTEHPVRILLTTDAASEGIDLQRHCHRLVNYDIPFNPNKLEQRIGRVDRYGQRTVAEIRHFVGTGWHSARPGSYEADLEFLTRVATKVARMEEDLGRVNAVLAVAVQDRMLGRLSADFDVDNPTTTQPTRRRPGGQVRSETNVRAQVVRLREQLNTTVDALNVTPQSVARVVGTALELARQQPLEPVDDDAGLADGGLFAVPPLTGSWERATRGLAYQLETKRDQERPITFDPTLAAGRDDVVLAHLSHPLTDMAVGLLRTAMWHRGTDLHRVTALVCDDPELRTTLLAAYARLVVVGRDGTQLHEEVVQAGGWIPERGRFARLDGVQALAGLLTRALNARRPVPASDVVRARLVGRWPRDVKPLQDAIEARAQTRRESLANTLANRRDEEVRRITANLEHFAATLRRALAADEPEDGQLMLPLAEFQQRQRDRQAWQDRLHRLAAEQRQEVELIERRFQIVEAHVFPAAVVYLVPMWEATR